MKREGKRNWGEGAKGESRGKGKGKGYEASLELGLRLSSGLRLRLEKVSSLALCGNLSIGGNDVPEMLALPTGNQQ